MTENLNVCMIGYRFMGRAHSNAYLKAERFFNLPVKPVMDTIVGLDLIALAPFAARWGWSRYSTAWKEAARDPAINLVDICTPNNMHAEQALAALAAGKHVACEKPLAGTLKDARAMRNAAAKARNSKTFVWYNYRRVPAVALAHQLVQEGRLGQLYHLRACFLESWGGPETPLTWRFQKKYAGSGSHGDLNSHVVDLARFITGQDIVEVCGALCETFITERPLPNNARHAVAGTASLRKAVGKSDVDDCTLFLARFSGGAVGSFEATRLATGYQNNNMFELHGQQGALRFSFEDMNVLWYFDAREEPRTAGWRRIICTTPGNHPYAGAWWAGARAIGYEHTFVHMVADMMAVLAGEPPIVPLPDFADAYETQRVLEAALLSARERSAVKLSEIK